MLKSPSPKCRVYCSKPLHACPAIASGDNHPAVQKREVFQSSGFHLLSDLTNHDLTQRLNGKNSHSCDREKLQKREAWLLEDEPRIQAHWREVDEFLNRPSYGVPASKMAILGLYMPRWSDLIRGEHRCAICLEDMEPRQKFRMMPCSHSCHQLCIFNWLQINRLCPVCQFALPSDEEQRLSDEQAARCSCKMETQDDPTHEHIID